MYYKIKTNGILSYLKGLLDPIFIMAPINVLSEISTPVSMAFRHFGNILSGTVISTLLYWALASLSHVIFGWLPGADHGVFSHAQSSIPALEAALEALRPGGVLSAILYSGKVIGSDEKTEILQWMRSRPLKQCTALVCGFANWADTAPLPCFLLKK